MLVSGCWLLACFWLLAGSLGLVASGLRLSASGLRLAAIGLWLAASGMRLADSGLWVAASGLWVAASGLRLAASNLGMAASGLRLAASGLWLASSSLRMACGILAGLLTGGCLIGCWRLTSGCCLIAAGFYPTCFFYQARESSLVPEGFPTGQFLQKLYFITFVVMGELV